jgi:hypothetical protein
VHFPCEFLCSLGLTNQQVHRSGVDSPPITTGRFVSLGVSFRGAFQKPVSSLSCRSGRSQIFLSAAKHTERFFTCSLFAAQILQNGIGALGRFAA